jgi:hypothetical protein
VPPLTATYDGGGIWTVGDTTPPFKATLADGNGDVAMSTIKSATFTMWRRSSGYIVIQSAPMTVDTTLGRAVYDWGSGGVDMDASPAYDWVVDVERADGRATFHGTAPIQIVD